MTELPDTRTATTTYVLGSIAQGRRTELGLTQQALAARVGVMLRLFDALDLSLVVTPRTVATNTIDLDELLRGHGA